MYIPSNIITASCFGLYVAYLLFSDISLGAQKFSEGAALNFWNYFSVQHVRSLVVTVKFQWFGTSDVQRPKPVPKPKPQLSASGNPQYSQRLCTEAPPGKKWLHLKSQMAIFWPLIIWTLVWTWVQTKSDFNNSAFVTCLDTPLDLCAN